jgi:hypothetical protein
MKTIKRSYICVNYNDIDDAINDFLKAKECKLNDRYEIACMEELSNDTSVEYLIDGEDFEDEKNKILNSKLNKYRTIDILNWMASENIIEKGLYLIKISWLNNVFKIYNKY